MNDPLELTIKATTQDVRRGMDRIETYLKNKGVHPQTALDIQLAVDEALTNIVEHGYHRQEGRIQVRCDHSGTDIVLRIEDSARPFNPLSVQEPELNSDLERRRIGGLGIFLMRRKMDDATYEFKNGKNVLTLKKKSSPAIGPQSSQLRLS